MYRESSIFFDYGSDLPGIGNIFIDYNYEDGLTMLLAIPDIMDFPAFVTGNYVFTTGEVLSCQMLYKKDLGRKQVQLKNDKTGEVITVDLYNCPSLYLEENVTVKYLKHTKKRINEILIPKLLAGTINGFANENSFDKE